MNGRFIFAGLLLALAACEGGSEGGNSAEGNSTAEPTVLERVPENLMDDPRNEAVPIEPPLPTPTSLPGPLAPPEPAVKRSATDEVGPIPAAFHGRWTAQGTRCDELSDGGLTVTADNLRFYESVARVDAVEPLPGGGVRARLAFSGEGERWTRDVQITAPGKNKLRIVQEGSPGDYSRCSAQA